MPTTIDLERCAGCGADLDQYLGVVCLGCGKATCWDCAEAHDVRCPDHGGEG